MIDKITFGNTGLQVSKIAMGGIPIMRLSLEEAVKVIRGVLDLGINFIDTANGYGDSEEKIGRAIADRDRKKLVIASKSTAPDRKTFHEHIQLSLERLGTDYIDIYHLHAVNSKEKLEEVMSEGGAFEALLEAKNKGIVRHLAFSSHHLPEAKELMNTGKFEVLQIPLNFVDTQAAGEIVPLARQLGLGFIAMKPMGGGLLQDTNLAFTYLGQFPWIVPDPGIEKLEEMEEIVRVASSPRELTAKDRARMQQVATELGSEYCHRCDYCQPCPQGIPISTVLILKSTLKRAGRKGAVQWVGKAIEKARSCTECETCLDRCPYNLPIPQLLKKNTALWDELGLGDE